MVPTAQQFRRGGEDNGPALARHDGGDCHWGGYNRGGGSRSGERNAGGVKTLQGTQQGIRGAAGFMVARSGGGGLRPSCGETSTKRFRPPGGCSEHSPPSRGGKSPDGAPVAPFLGLLAAPSRLAPASALIVPRAARARSRAFSPSEPNSAPPTTPSSGDPAGADAPPAPTGPTGRMPALGHPRAGRAR